MIPLHSTPLRYIGIPFGTPYQDAGLQFFAAAGLEAEILSADQTTSCQPLPASLANPAAAAKAKAKSRSRAKAKAKSAVTANTASSS